MKVIYTCKYPWCILKNLTVHCSTFYWPCASLNQIQPVHDSPSPVSLNWEFLWHVSRIPCVRHSLIWTNRPICLHYAWQIYATLLLTKGHRNQHITQMEQDPIYVWCHWSNLGLINEDFSKKYRISISTHPFWLYKKHS